ncbi:hypothetical protein ACKAV7_001808 [Fusarium commune]
MPPNQREVQRQLMKKYNIFFDDPIESEGNPQWPRSFIRIFQAVRQLSKRDSMENSGTAPCQATATSQSGDDVRNSLRARQSRRQPCKCNRTGGAPALLDNGISPIFDDRAEQGIACSPELLLDLPKREVKPDRVYGLQTTKRFNPLLELVPDIRSNPFKPDGFTLNHLLLIIDYIADWARDIYREGIASSLQKLALSDSASLAHDEDVYSKAGGLRSRASSLFDTSRAASHVGDSRVPSHIDSDPVQSQSDIGHGTMKQVVIEDYLHKFDHESGVFRHVKIVHSKFTGLLITHENVEEFLHTSTTIGETKSLVLSLLTQLQDVCLVKGHMLNYLELLWTDTNRKLPEMLRPEELFYTIVTVTFYLTPNWEPTQELSYLAFSQKLVQYSMRSHNNIKTKKKIKLKKGLK